MLSQLIRKNKYFHLKLIHQHPNGIQSRFKNTADKWVQSINYPHIKSYYQFHQNIQTHQYQVNLPMREIQEQHISGPQYAYKPGLAKMLDFTKYFDEKRPDDYQIVQEAKDMTFKKFIQQGKKNFSISHKLVSWTLGFIVFHVAVYFGFYYGKQIPRTQRVKVLNPQVLENYYFQQQQKQIKQIMQKIKIYNDQYQKQLALATKSK